MKKQLISILITIFVVSAYAILQSSPTNAAPQVDAVAQTDISYSEDVYPILESRCGKCHMGKFTNKNLNMETYTSLMTGSQDGPVIIAGDANESLLLEKISKGQMPKRGPKLTPEQIQIITNWINAGAKNN